MKICSNINYYYQQTVQSNAIKKSTQITTAVAFYTFHGLKYAALVPAALTSLIIAVPAAIITASLLVTNVGFQFISKKICGLEILDSVPTNVLQQIVLTINSITDYILFKIAYVSMMITLSPCIIVTTGIDYIEDITTQISQTALDTLGIPVQLSISRRKLVSILNEWRRNALPEENREKACKKILDFHSDSGDLASNMFSFRQSLYLNDCQLRDLPNIFHYQPFSKINTLSLSDNQLTILPESIRNLQQVETIYLINNYLTTLPENIYELPRNCTVFINNNRFSSEEVSRIINTTNVTTYEGPNIIGVTITDRREVLPGIESGDNTLSIDDLYSKLYHSVDRKPQDLSNLEQSETLRSWLNRLSDVSDYKGSEDMRRSLIINVINYLEEANRNADFRDIFKNIIEYASASCGDRVTLSILQIDIAYQLASIDPSNMQRLSEFLLRGGLAIELLEECARQKINSMQGAVDPIEVYLGYPIVLKEQLRLPISQETMLYFNCSYLNHQDLDTAKEFVMSHLKDREVCLTYLIKHNKWKKALAGYKPEEFAAIERKRENNLEKAESEDDYTAIENDYNQALKELSAPLLDD